MKKFILITLIMFGCGIMTMYSQQTSAIQETKGLTGVTVADQQPASPNPQLSVQEREAYLETLSEAQKQTQSDANQGLDPELNPNKPSTQEPGEMVPETVTPPAELDDIPTPNHPNGRKSDTQ